MILPLLLIQAAPAATPAARPPLDENTCTALAEHDPAAALRIAGRWRIAGGGVAARRCEGVALADQQQWSAAAASFEDAAHAAETARDPRAADCWAQAGNAWLAAGTPARARSALDAALAAGTLTGLPLGEARLDRARALVAVQDMEGARRDIDAALTTAGDDPLAWLLSATLARRTGDLPRAHQDIAQALARAADDPSVQLEAGNIAAASGDASGAQAAWREAVRLRPDGPLAASARTALAQFATPAS